MPTCDGVGVEVGADARVSVGVNASVLDVDLVVLLDTGADSAGGGSCCAGCVVYSIGVALQR